MKTMKKVGVILTLLCVIYSVLAGRRYIAIPIDGIDGIDIMEVNHIVPPRSVRQTEAYVPNVIHQDESKHSELSTRILDYVDFGGNTGSNGAYSWYADYPAHHL